jgi:ATP/maltotriose-dependent transcriptional regulator MalT
VALQQQTLTAHLNFYCAFAEEGERQLRGGRVVVWMKRIREATGNWSSALDWGNVHNPEVAARLACHLAFFWFSSGQMHIGRTHYQRLLEKQDQLSPETRAWTKIWYTALLWPTGALHECEQMAHDTLRQFVELDDIEGVILSHHHLAVVAAYSGDVATAAAYWTQALAIADSADTVSPWFRLSILQGLGTCLPMLGRLQEAYEISADCYQLTQASGNLIVGCYAMGNLARLEIERGRLHEATELANRALAIAQDLNDQRAESIQYLVLGNIALAQRDFATAVQQLEIARRIGEAVQNNDILDEATMLLGRDAYTGMGDYDRAFEALQSWAAICLRLNNEINMAVCLERLAGVYWHLQPGNLDSVRWAAAASAWRGQASDFPVAPEESYRHKLVALMRSEMMDETFIFSWRAGLEMPLREALSTGERR